MARNRDDSAIVKKAWITRRKNMARKARMEGKGQKRRQAATRPTRVEDEPFGGPGEVSEEYKKFRAEEEARRRHSRALKRKVEKERAEFAAQKKRGGPATRERVGVSRDAEPPVRGKSKLPRAGEVLKKERARSGKVRKARMSREEQGLSGMAHRLRASGATKPGKSAGNKKFASGNAEKHLGRAMSALRSAQKKIDDRSREYHRLKKSGTATKTSLDFARKRIGQAEQGYVQAENDVLKYERELGRNPKRRTSAKGRSVPAKKATTKFNYHGGKRTRGPNAEEVAAGTAQRKKRNQEKVNKASSAYQAKQRAKIAAKKHRVSKAKTAGKAKTSVKRPKRKLDMSKSGTELFIENSKREDAKVVRKFKLPHKTKGQRRDFDKPKKKTGKAKPPRRRN